MTKELTGRSLDAEIAIRFFRFEWWRSSVSGGRALFAGGARPAWFTERATGDEPLCTDWDVIPRYSESIEAAFQLEDRIAELGLQRQYYRALVNVVATSISDRLFQWFDLVHATAEQRCRAAIAAAQKGNNDE